MSKFATCLIESNAIVREGLKSILGQAHDYDLVLEADSPDRLADKPELDLVDIALIGVECDSRLIESRLGKAKHYMPKAYILMLISGSAPDCVATAFASGADGVLQNDISTASLPVYLNLILLGEKVLPSALAGHMATSRDMLNGHNSLLHGHHLSLREIEIIRCLADGAPNKVIARHLDISEATVKVHIKTILRKLGLSNRTQAALWAIQHDLVSGVAPTITPELQSAAQMAEPGLKQYLPA